MIFLIEEKSRCARAFVIAFIRRRHESRQCNVCMQEGRNIVPGLFFILLGKTNERRLWRQTASARRLHEYTRERLWTSCFYFVL